MANSPRPSFKGSSLIQRPRADCWRSVHCYLGLTKGDSVGAGIKLESRWKTPSGWSSSTSQSPYYAGQSRHCAKPPSANDGRAWTCGSRSRLMIARHVESWTTVGSAMGHGAGGIAFSPSSVADDVPATARPREIPYVKEHGCQMEHRIICLSQPNFLAKLWARGVRCGRSRNNRHSELCGDPHAPPVSLSHPCALSWRFLDLAPNQHGEAATAAMQPTKGIVLLPYRRQTAKICTPDENLNLTCAVASASHTPRHWSSTALAACGKAERVEPVCTARLWKGTHAGVCTLSADDLLTVLELTFSWNSSTLTPIIRRRSQFCVGDRMHY